MRSGSLDEMELKVLGMLFPEFFKNRLESLNQEVIAQSGISEIRIDRSKYFSDAIEVFITGGNNEIISACNIIFENFILDPLSKARIDILIPEQNAGKIIGFKGKNITKLCRNTRASINISKYSPALRVGNIEGTLEMILKAVKQIFYWIYDIPENSGNLDGSFHSTQSNPGAPKPPSQKSKKKNFEKRVERETAVEITKMITVPQNMVGWLLGRYMVGLQKLKEMSECDITLLDSAGVDINAEAEEMRIFQVKGMPKKVDIAIELIKAETNKLKLKAIERESKLNSKNQIKNKENASSWPEEDEGNQRETEQVSEKKWKKKNKSKNKIAKKEIEEEEKKIPLIEDFTRLNIPKNQKAVSLVIGQTGSGKSTFINYLTNFFRKGSLENRKIAIPTKNFKYQTERDFNHTERLISSDQSQTNNCCPYNFIDLESSSTFTFIDTPGIGDTRGVDQDDENIQKIVKEVVNYPNINAIIIVQNGSEARNTASVKYTLNKLRNSLPSLVEKNVILILTNSAISSNFNESSLQIVPRKKITMDNNAFNVENFQNLDEYQKSHLQLSWNNSMKKIKELVEFICTMGTVGTKVFKEMWNEINIAKQNFHYAKLQLANLYNLMEKLEDVRGQRELSLNEAIAYQNFKQTETVEQTEWTDTPYHNTVCTNDDSLCHERCRLHYTPNTNSSIFTGCACMGSSPTCTVCNCGHNSHYHTKKIPRKVQKTVENILHNVKRQHDWHKARANQLQIEESNCEKDLKNVQESIEDTKRKIRKAVQNLRRVAPNYNIADEIDGVLQQARMQLKIEKLPKQRAKTRVVIKVLEEIYNNLLG